MKLKGILFTVISALLYGFTPILASLTYGMGNNPMTLTFFRSLFVVPVLAMILFANKISFRIPEGQLKNIIFISIFSVSTTLLVYSSYQYIGVGTSTTLHFLYPVFVALLCRFFYREKLGSAKILALIIASCGIVFFIDFNNAANMIGILMALVSGITFAFYMVFIEKKGLAKINPYLLSFYLASFVCLFLFAYHIFIPSFTFNQPALSYGLMFVIALCTSFLAVILLQLGIKELGSTTASIFCMFEPISSVICGVIFLNESISLFKIIGCFIILGAVTLMIICKPKAKKLTPTQ